MYSRQSQILGPPIRERFDEHYRWKNRNSSWRNMEYFFFFFFCSETRQRERRNLNWIFQSVIIVPIRRTRNKYRDDSVTSVFEKNLILNHILL